MGGHLGTTAEPGEELESEGTSSWATGSAPHERERDDKDGTGDEDDAGSDRRTIGSARPVLVRSFSQSMHERKTRALSKEGMVGVMVRQNALEEEARGWRWLRQLQWLVKSPRFEAFFCFIIICNAILIGVETQYTSSFELPEPPAAFEAMSLAFTLLFTMEFLLRLTVGLREFFCGGMYLWNLLDGAIVLVSWTEFVYGRSGRAGAQQLTYVRLLRVVRTVRIFRVMRALKDFASLRILLYSILTTMRSLIWTLLLLAIIMYVFGIMFTQSAAAYLIETPGDNDMRLYWGSLWQSSYTLFKAVTGGVTWQEVSAPLGRVHAVIEMIFIVFISFTYFAVLNVVTGVFCHSAIESANHDKDMVVQQQMANRQMYTEQLQDVFRSIDVEQTGSVTFGMFEQALLNEDNQLKVYLDSLGITPDDAWNLFRLMDTDESDDIEMEEFVAACLRLRGSARAVDSHLLMYQSRWIMQKLCDLQRSFQDLMLDGMLDPQARGTRRFSLAPLEVSRQQGTAPRASRASFATLRASRASQATSRPSQATSRASQATSRASRATHGAVKRSIRFSFSNGSLQDHLCDHGQVGGTGPGQTLASDTHGNACAQAALPPEVEASPPVAKQQQPPPEPSRVTKVEGLDLYDI